LSLLPLGFGCVVASVLTAAALAPAAAWATLPGIAAVRAFVLARATDGW
jgi:hypothetical protein